MISAAGTRLAIVTVLLVLQTLILILELLIFNSTVKARRWYTPLRQWFGPIGIALLGVVLVPVTFAHPTASIEKAGTQCSIDVDADVAGEGVRIAAFAQVCVLILVSLLGSFHTKATGSKEVGAGLALTSVSLAMALIVRMGCGTLTPVDAAVSAMILDGQSMAQSIQLTAKETLTSRWQVGIAVSAQFIGLGTISAIVAGLNDRSYASNDCSCLTVFWRGWLGNCQPTLSSLEPAVFWTYIACRFVCVIQMSLHAIWNTVSFDRAEKDTRDTGDVRKKLGGTLLNITYPHFTKRGSARYGEYPATVTFTYAFYGVLALTSLVTAETTIRDHQLHPSSGIDSTGQVFALVIAAVTILRAGWLFVFMFWHDDSGMPDLTNPFKLQQSRFSSAPVYIHTSDYTRSRGTIPLGSLLMDPFDLDSKYNSHIPVSPKDQKKIPTLNWSDGKHHSHSWNFQFASTVYSLFSNQSETAQAESMEVSTFIPSADYLSQCAAQPEIRNDFGAGTMSVTVYLVVGLMIATGLRVTKTKSKGTSAAGVSASADFSRQHDQESTNSPDGTVLYAYSVQEVTLRGDKNAISNEADEADEEGPKMRTR
jgi:hypothetical protein